jgi:hypothetical protein
MFFPNYTLILNWKRCRGANTLATKKDPQPAWPGILLAKAKKAVLISFS